MTDVFIAGWPKGKTDVFIAGWSKGKEKGSSIGIQLTESIIDLELLINLGLLKTCKNDFAWNSYPKLS